MVKRQEVAGVLRVPLSVRQELATPPSRAPVTLSPLPSPMCVPLSLWPPRSPPCSRRCLRPSPAAWPTTPSPTCSTLTRGSTWTAVRAACRASWKEVGALTGLEWGIQHALGVLQMGHDPCLRASPPGRVHATALHSTRTRHQAPDAQTPAKRPTVCPAPNRVPSKLTLQYPGPGSGVHKFSSTPHASVLRTVLHPPPPSTPPGTRSIGVLYRALIFTFLPTIVELGAVTVLLASRCARGLAGRVRDGYVYRGRVGCRTTRMTTNGGAGDNARGKRTCRHGARFGSMSYLVATGTSSDACT